jgi:hypothetical protein
MTDAIIGGAIAAVIGAIGGVITGLLLERRREKTQRLTIVNALVIETSENLVICKDFEERELWWTVSFKLEAYDSYKGQLFFLPEDVRVRLVNTALAMQESNTITQVLQQAAAFGQNFPTKPMSTPKELIEQLEFINKELRKWRAKQSRSLVFRIRRRLRNFTSKIRNNSKLNHS